MTNKSAIRELLSQCQPGHSLPQAFYTDEAVFAADMAGVFGRSWALIGFECELPKSGSYLATTLAGSPIIILRNKDGQIVGFHNSCRHRGARICTAASGTAPRLVCPYHQWTYGLDGELISAPRMGDDFETSGRNLQPIKVETAGGCIYVSLFDGAPDFEPFRQAIEANLAPYNLREAKVAHIEVLEEQANWKLVMENGRECLHCAVCHPELSKVVPVGTLGSAEDDQARIDEANATRLAELGIPTLPAHGDWWEIGRFGFLDGVKSFALDGQPVVSRKLIDVDGGIHGTLRWATQPNNFVHAAADCLVMVAVEPVSAKHSRVVAKWLVHKDAVEGVDYQRDRLIEAWDTTNRQDRALAENNQAGINGFGYVPGPYSPSAENHVINFVEWYRGRLAEFILE